MANRKKVVLTMAGLLLAGSVHASDAASDDTAVRGPIPAPPGPYQSSQPYLYDDAQGRHGELPYYGAMHYPFPQERPPYFGPGRYWAPADIDQSQRDRRFATTPVPPWGGRTPSGENGQQAQVERPGEWGRPHSGGPMWGPPPQPYRGYGGWGGRWQQPTQGSNGGQ